MPPLYLFFMLVMLVMLSNVCVWLAQQVRKLMRSAVNSIFTEPVSKGSSPELQSIVQLITGQAISSAVAITLIHFDHRLRDGMPDRHKFILCPIGAKRERSTLHGLSSADHKDFFKLLQNAGRITPLFDTDGKQINLLDQDKYCHHTAESPLFNDITAFLFFHVFAKGPRMLELFVGDIFRRDNGTHDMSKVFEKRVTTPTGELGEHIVGPRMMALLDFYLATSIYGGIPAAQDHRPFFELRAKQYGALTGLNGMRDMRKELQLVLEGYIDRFPHILVQVRRSRKSGASIDSGHVVDLTAEELREFASGPAGGARPAQSAPGAHASGMGADEGGAAGSAVAGGTGGVGGSAPQASAAGSA